MFSDLAAGLHSRGAATLKSIVTKSLLSLRRSEVLLAARMLSRLPPDDITAIGGSYS